MSEADNITTSEDLSGGNVVVNTTTPLDTFIDSPPPPDSGLVAPAVPQAPVDPLAAPEQSPLEQRITAIEKAFDELNDHVVKSIGTRLMTLDEGLKDVSEAWLQFAQAGTKVLDECRALGQGSDNAVMAELDRRLKIIEASRL